MAESTQRDFSDTLQVTATRTVTVQKLMRLRVVTPAAVVFQGAVRSLVAPAWDGLAGVLPGHAPYLTALGDGRLDVDPESGARRSFHLSGGVMKVEANRVDVLADRVTTPVSADAALPGVEARASVSGA